VVRLKPSEHQRGMSPSETPRPSRKATRASWIRRRNSGWCSNRYSNQSSWDAKPIKTPAGRPLVGYVPAALASHRTGPRCPVCNPPRRALQASRSQTSTTATLRPQRRHVRHHWGCPCLSRSPRRPHHLRSRRWRRTVRTARCSAAWRFNQDHHGRSPHATSRRIVAGSVRKGGRRPSCSPARPASRHRSCAIDATRHCVRRPGTRRSTG